MDKATREARRAQDNPKTLRDVIDNLKSEDEKNNGSTEAALAAIEAQKPGITIYAPDPETAAMRKRIEAGMADIEVVIQQRNKALEDLRTARDEIAQLKIDIEQARKDERAKLREVNEKLVLAGKEVLLVRDSLMRENDDLRVRLRAANDERDRMTARRERLRAFLDAVSGAIDQTKSGDDL